MNNEKHLSPLYKNLVLFALAILPPSTQRKSQRNSKP